MRVGESEIEKDIAGEEMTLIEGEKVISWIEFVALSATSDKWKQKFKIN